MNGMLSIAAKDLRIAMRDKAGFFWRFGFPLIMAVFFGTIFSGGGDGARGKIRVAVVDQDATAGSAAFIERIAAGSEIDVVRDEAGELLAFEAAENQVRRGRITAYLLLKPGFGEASTNPFAGGGAEVELGVDPARQAEAAMLEGLLTAYGFKGLVENFTEPDAATRMIRENLDLIGQAEDLSPASRMVLEGFLRGAEGLVTSEAFRSELSATPANGSAPSSGAGSFGPLKIERKVVAIERRGPANAYEISFTQGFVWALIGTAASFSVGLVLERKRGTLLRLRMAPIRNADVLGGKAVACFVMLMGNILVLMAIGVLVFRLRPHAPGLFLLAVTCASLCFVGIMMLLSVLGRTEEAVSGIGWAVMMVIAMTGGGMIPLMIMPGWMQAVSNFSPVKWAVLAIEGSMWRGFSLVEMLPACGILLGVGVVCFALGARLSARTDAD